MIDEAVHERPDRSQSTLLPECLDDWVGESNLVSAVDAFVDALDLAKLGFKDVEPAATGRPGYHPVPFLKLYIYGYLDRIQSSRRLEREARRNLEVIWLFHRLSPDDKTIADFRKDKGTAIPVRAANAVSDPLCQRPRSTLRTTTILRSSSVNDGGKVMPLSVAASATIFAIERTPNNT